MNNLEIVSIINTYTARKTQIAKARAEGIDAKSVTLPAQIAWKRRLNLNDLFKAKRVIDEALQEAREPYLHDEYSSATEDGGRQIKPEFIKEFMAAQNEILAQDTEVVIRKVKISDLGDIELADEDMDTIAFMIEE